MSRKTLRAGRQLRRCKPGRCDTRSRVAALAQSPPRKSPLSHVLDARYEKVRINGSVVSCAVLIATGVLADGKRPVRRSLHQRNRGSLARGFTRPEETRHIQREVGHQR
ncbi:transposase [Hyphomicrobium sp.]|uniref:transposase n=1 Tax=Hyphomicrobium sp. TaxID=82 RepID=UPI0035619A56